MYFQEIHCYVNSAYIQRNYFLEHETFSWKMYICGMWNSVQWKHLTKFFFAQKETSW